MKIIITVQATSQILAKNVAKLYPESGKICLKSPKTSISSNLSKFWQILAPFLAQKLKYEKISGQDLRNNLDSSFYFHVPMLLKMQIVENWLRKSWNPLFLGQFTQGIAVDPLQK